ncbi:MAG: hypothetical protein DMF06_07105 [Verrucomicrobia bacterium]|nr:MAG: hypothetical protein DMF06_07105 [Verrucomicrobiota bacterium]
MVLGRRRGTPGLGVGVTGGVAVGVGVGVGVGNGAESWNRRMPAGVSKANQLPSALATNVPVPKSVEPEGMSSPMLRRNNSANV